MKTQDYVDGYNDALSEVLVQLYFRAPKLVQYMPKNKTGSLDSMKKRETKLKKKLSDIRRQLVFKGV